MKSPRTLFEVSWEVCNKVGGIHTVVATKALLLRERLGDGHVLVGPWLLGQDGGPRDFEPEPGHEEFSAACRAAGLPVRVGRWNIPGRPRALLVQFSGLFERKDAILAGLWERYRVDSLTGGWDYVEPVLFGHAAGEVIRIWQERTPREQSEGAVAQFHEWMTAAGLLHLKDEAPTVGTVFTTHATVLGRAISGGGVPPLAGLGARTPDEAAAALGVRAKHSLEAAAAREADAFTTVSELTADEAERLLGRRPAPVTPNGIDLAVLDAQAAGTEADAARARLLRVAEAFLGAPVADAALAAISGRYEFHNKGLDLLLDAAAELRGRAGRPLILFVLVPAGATGLRRSVRERLHQGAAAVGPIGHCTHRLNDPDGDPVLCRLRELGIHNAAGDRVRVIQVPAYLEPGDEIFDLPYEAAISGFDFTCFPSFYEPWGYTPVESLARGVPTITSDWAGFGRWLIDHGLEQEGVALVLRRAGRSDAEARRDLVDMLERFIALPREPERARRCRDAADQVAWRRLMPHQEAAFDAALVRAAARAALSGPQPRLKPLPLPQAPAPRGGPRLERMEVVARLEGEAEGLRELARDFWWTWHPEAERLFASLDPELWESVGHHPLRLLARLDPRRLQDAIDHQPGFGARVQQLLRLRAADLAAPVPAATAAALDARRPVAYFSAEFALHESLPVYSGGLGVLAGDHLKSASDLCLPLVGVGLMYGRGYLRQRLSPSGEQMALEVEQDPRTLALEQALDAAGKPLQFALPLPGGEVQVRAWRAHVGRTDLYLLDTDHPANQPEERAITRQLYGGDHEMRLRQEIILGRGGVRLLRALGLEPAVYHLNEGHAAFVGLERLRFLLPEQGLSFAEGLLLVAANTVFTTHTPVPAGHDAFDEDLMRKYFGDAPSWLGASWEEFLALGRAPGGAGPFNMTFLACRLSGWRNGVSALHGEVSRDLLHPLWPGRLRGEVPVHSVTNGVHLGTWAAEPVARLVRAPDAARVGPADYAARAPSLDLTALWAARQACRRHLLEAARRNLVRAFVERADSPRLLDKILHGLQEDALLIGFARRFAPYKRAHLLFHDLDRLAALVDQPGRPVRIFFAGKAHPRDAQGQAYLQRVFEVSRDPRFAGRLILLENYEMDLGRALTAGADVWLNTPIRKLEASGTSGMKAAASGALNLSILDGWWKEGCDGTHGWALGAQRIYREQGMQDELDATALYRLLEEDIVPLFFARGAEGVPHGWLERVRRGLSVLPPVFSTDRMVAEYRDRAYLTGAAAARALAREGCAGARAQAARIAEYRRAMPQVRVLALRGGDLHAAKIGDQIPVEAEVDLAGLGADRVAVELVLGLSGQGRPEAPPPLAVRLAHAGRTAGGADLFRASWSPEQPGSWGYGVRVRAEDGVPADVASAELTVWA